MKRAPGLGHTGWTPMLGDPARYQRFRSMSSRHVPCRPDLSRRVSRRKPERLEERESFRVSVVDQEAE